MSGQDCLVAKYVCAFEGQATFQFVGAHCRRLPHTTAKWTAPAIHTLTLTIAILWLLEALGKTFFKVITNWGSLDVLRDYFYASSNLLENTWAELFILWADERWYGLYRSVIGQSSYLLANWSGVVIEVKVNSINNASWLNYEDSTRIRLCR